MEEFHGEWKIDKTDWADGPWMHETDKESWTTKAGLPGLIVRSGGSGSLCGYAAVNPGHPLWGEHYDMAHRIVEDLSVHGGLTYASACGGPICHIAQPGEPENVWWFGFDCAHGFDVMPRYLNMYKEIAEASEAMNKLNKLVDEHNDPDYMRNTYKNAEFVKAEVESLAAQLRKVEMCKLSSDWRMLLRGRLPSSSQLLS